MPVYEYYCQTCNVEFEQLLIQRDEIKEYKDFYPCPSCKELSPRIPSATNFNFKGTAGNSGSHDLDYPTLDKAVGRSANRRWKEYHERKAARDAARRKLGTNTITTDGLSSDSKILPVNNGHLGNREKGIKLFKRTLKAT